MPTTTETEEPKTYSRRRRPKGKIPCVAIGSPRITRTRVKPDFSTAKLREYRAWIPTGLGKQGLLHLTSSTLPRECTYNGDKYNMVGIKFDGDLVFEKDGDGLV